MNYFEFHIGDYDKATAHLTACEDGLYGRLMRRYYDTEEALPNDLPLLMRVCRARSREEKTAFRNVLSEFFYLNEQTGAWHHRRIDAEIDRYNLKKNKARASANARWSQSERNANASADSMPTHSEGNAHQTPDTRHQAPEASTTPTARVGSVGPDTAPGRACRLMREAGLQRSNPSDPRLLEALTAGVTPEQLADLVRENPGKAMAWYCAAALGRRRDAAEQGRAAPGAPLAAPPIDPVTKWRREREHEFENRLIAIRHRRDMLGLDPAEADSLIAEAREQHRALIERGPEVEAA